MTEEIKPVYKLIETFDGITKSTEIITNDLTELFSCTMDFLKYCGISKVKLKEYFNLYNEGLI